jgi:hypothetical protein
MNFGSQPAECLLPTVVYTSKTVEAISYLAGSPPQATFHPMSSSFADNELVGTLNIFFGEDYATAWRSWPTISGTVKDMATALNARGLPYTDTSVIPDMIFISKGGKDGGGRPAGVRFCWKTPGSTVDDALLQIFDTVKFAAACQCDMMRKPDGRVVAYYPRNQQREAGKGRVPFKNALEERGLLHVDAGNTLVRFHL